MRLETLSIIAGTAICNAKCPYCISQMTPNQMQMKEVPINWRNLDIALRLVKQHDVSTVLITGKGEPTLYPKQISQYMDALEKYRFPFIELQTNGIILQKRWSKYRPYLEEWYRKGMTTIAISIVHYDYEKNKQIFTPEIDYIDLPKLIANLHDIGFTVRLAGIFCNGYIYDGNGLRCLLDFAKKNKVEQVSARPVNKPHDCQDKDVEKWIEQNMLTDAQYNSIVDYLDNNGHKLIESEYGAIIYDVDGQNFCLTNSLTGPKHEQIRQLIFFPDGRLRYDWQYEGAVLL